MCIFQHEWGHEKGNHPLSISPLLKRDYRSAINITISPREPPIGNHAGNHIFFYPKYGLTGSEVLVEIEKAFSEVFS
jgi:hypothetical protein